MATFSMDNVSMNRLLYEDLFFQAVQLANANIDARNDGSMKITTSMARKLHDDMMRHLDIKDERGRVILGSNALESSTLSVSNVEEAINAAFLDVNDGEDLLVPAEGKRYSSLYYECFTEISKAFDFKKRSLDEARAVSDAWRAEKETPQSGFVPLSPYDTSNMSKAVFLENGHKMLYFDRRNLVPTASPVTFGLDDSAQNEVYAFSTTASGKETFRKVGEYMSEDDITGLSSYAPYITKKDYAAVKAHVNSKVKQTPGYKADPHMIQTGIAILRKLKHAGIKYKIVPDDRTGQIKAVIEGTKVSVRVRDDEYGGKYVGKIYDDGVGITLDTNDTVTGPNGGRQKAPYQPTVSDIITALRYYRGEAIELPSLVDRAGKSRVDSDVTYIGQPGLYHQPWGAKSSPGQLVFQNGQKKTDIVMRPADTNAGREIVLKIDPSNRSKATRVFGRIEGVSIEEEAETFLRESIDSSKKYFESLVNVDGLVQLAEEHADDADFQPPYSSDSTVASLQRVYWGVLTGKDEHLLHLSVTKGDFKENQMLDEASDEDELIGNLFNALEFDSPDLEYDGTPEEKVRAHMADAMQSFFGTYEAQFEHDEATGKDALLRFDAANVSKYMNTSNNVFRNNTDIIEAIRILGIDPNELRGDDYFNQSIKDRLVIFDATTAIPMKNSNSEFIQRMFDVTKLAIETSGCRVNDDDILIDENGIVSYTATRCVFNSTNPTEPTKHSYEVIHGQIGQIFDVEPTFGSVETHFGGTPNYAFVPGYEATVVPATGEYEGKSLEERMLLKGYEQLMTEQIRATVRSDIVTSSVVGDEIAGTTVSLNSVYKRVYDTRHDVEDIYEAMLSDSDIKFLEDYRSITDDAERIQFEIDHEDELHDIENREIKMQILQTEARRVRLGNDFKEGSTINAEFAARNGITDDGLNDNFDDIYALTGHRNLSLLGEKVDGEFYVDANGVRQQYYAGDGYFDKMATATGVNQGITRYLVEGAKVLPNGHIQPSEDLADRTPIMKNSIFRYNEFNPFDRNQMTFSNIMASERVVKRVGTAQMTFGGFNFDDGYIISRNFADKYPVHKAGAPRGTLRPLAIHDKIMDMNGNKGVIAMVVDRDDTMQTLHDRAIENGRSEAWWNKNKVTILKATAWYRANPHMDVVGAPFTAPSRFNSERELMEVPQDLLAPFEDTFKEMGVDAETLALIHADKDQKVFEGCMGDTTYIVTHHTGDKKSLVYDEDAMRAGKGRRASAQLAWGLTANDCTAIMNELYSTNDGAYVDFREYLITMGLDMSETGELRTEYHPHNGEQRTIFHLPELEYTESGRLDTAAMNAKFESLLSQNSGVLELPFPLTFPTGASLQPFNEDRTDVISYPEEYEVAGYTRKDGVYVAPYTRTKTVNAELTQTVYGLPVMSSALRSGTEMIDGTTSTHEYTNAYRKIYEQAYLYQSAMMTLQKPDLDDKSREAAERIIREAPEKAQAHFDRITEDVKSRVFEGKHNFYRDHLMSNRLADSATQVISADPTLELYEVAMPEHTAKSMHMKEGDWILTWRDPVISIGGIRMLQVTYNNELTGISINPAIDKSYEGDFDGDSFGIAKIKSQAALEEGLQKLSQQATLVDHESRTAVGENYALSIQDSLDISVAKAINPEFAARWNEIAEKANELEIARMKQLVDIADADGPAARAKAAAEFDATFDSQISLLEEESQLVREMFADQYGTAMVSFKDAQSHAESLFAYVQQGAKGNPKKLQEYFKQAGIEAEYALDADGNPVGICQGVTMAEHSFKNRDDDLGVQYATAVKAFGTGIAGMYPQRGMAANRNIAAEAVLGLTHPVTQANLQIKHNVQMANIIYPMLQGPVRELWRGRILEQTSEGNWVAMRDKNGEFVKPTPEQWSKNLAQVYDQVLGCPVNPDYIMEIATANSENGAMKNIEEASRSEAAPMDRGAYTDCSFAGTFKMAQEGANITDGKYNDAMASHIIRNNKALAAQGRAAEMAPIVAHDAQRISLPGKSKLATAVHDETEAEVAEKMARRAAQRASKQASNVVSGVDVTRTSSGAITPAKTTPVVSRGHEFDDVQLSDAAAQAQQGHGDMGDN